MPKEAGSCRLPLDAVELAEQFLDVILSLPFSLSHDGMTKLQVQKGAI